MCGIIRKVIVVAVVAGGALSLAGCTLGRNGNQDGSIYKTPAGNGSGDGGSSSGSAAEHP